MQVNLDFSGNNHIHDGKKEVTIPTASSTELKEFVGNMAKIKNVTASELTHRYIVEGLKSDIANTFMPEPHLDKSLRELLAKFK